LLIVKVRGVAVPRPGEGVATVTSAVPAVAMSAAAIKACKLELDTNGVGPASPFHSKVEEETKSEPGTVTARVGPPARALFGARALTDGGRLRGGFELPPEPEPPPQPASEAMQVQPMYRQVRGKP
jgi:hypothetical protein